MRLILFAGLGLVIATGLTGSLQPLSAQSNCSAAYPDVCMPPPPPDLDCKDITYRNFKVLETDPHRFDGDDDGIGCES